MKLFSSRHRTASPGRRVFGRPFRAAALAGLLSVVAAGTGCAGGTRPVDPVDYEPFAGAGWTVSTAAEQGLDPGLVAELYRNATAVDTIEALLVVRYGYQWRSVRAGDHRYSLAWRHGGQQIALLPGQELAVIVKADPLWGQHGSRPWREEKANLNFVANFIASLPLEP